MSPDLIPLVAEDINEADKGGEDKAAEFPEIAGYKTSAFSKKRFFIFATQN
jgi:hypothetical protein